MAASEVSPAEVDRAADGAAAGLAATGADAAAGARHGTGPGGRSSTRLIELLLNLVKQYYIAGEEHTIRDMLKDIAADGCDSRPLGHWGLVSARDVREVMAAFEVWKAEGQSVMPALYKSQTHNTWIDCVVARKNLDSTLDLTSQPVDTEISSSTIVKRRADPLLVRPRNVPNWFVPSMPGTEGATGAQTHTATAGMQAASWPAGGAATAAAGLGGAAAPAAPAAALEATVGVWTAQYAFNGLEWGPEYLVVDAGDELEQINVDDGGWAYGRLLRRVANPSAAASWECGWYPADSAVLTRRANVPMAGN